MIVDLFRFKTGYSFVWLLCLYIIGAYIKRVALLKDTSKIKLMAIFFVGSIVLLIGNALVKAVIHRNLNYFVSYISPVTLLMSSCLLLWFRDIKLNSIKGMIPFLSMVTFDVYLIHCHILIYDNYITDGFKWIADYNVILIPILIVISSLSILIVTSVVGGLRSTLFKIIKLDKLILKISQKADRLLYCKGYS